MGDLRDFVSRTLKAFRANQGLLLAGAVAYYALLSIVPMLILLVIALSHVVGEAELLEATARYLDWLIPGQGGAVTGELARFLQHRQVMGWVLLGTMVFFSSLAFTVLENAMSVIFVHRVAIRRRNFLVMPVGRLSWRHALIGGATAALLWELTRHLLLWYLNTLSRVSDVYGSLTTAIVILLSLELAAIVLLLGAQVIAEYERLDRPVRNAAPKPFRTEKAVG